MSRFSLLALMTFAGVTNVYVSVTVNKERIHFALKHYVKVDNWDKGRGGLKIKVPEAKETNAYLEQVKFTITTYYQSALD